MAHCLVLCGIWGPALQKQVFRAWTSNLWDVIIFPYPRTCVKAGRGWHLHVKCHFTNVGIPILEIRWSYDIVMFTMRIPISGNIVFIPNRHHVSRAQIANYISCGFCDMQFHMAHEYLGYGLVIPSRMYSGTCDPYGIHVSRVWVSDYKWHVFCDLFYHTQVLLYSYGFPAINQVACYPLSKRVWWRSQV